jgi:predicted ATPase/class 3 adenylate cyclase
MSELPTGTVTFLFTDIEGSTRLWERHAEPMRLALARHDALAAALVEAHAGTLVKSRGEGDSLFAVFARASDALAAACALQQALLAEAWPVETPLRVRMALHTGEADRREDSYYGAEVNRCARLRSVAHGGQVLLSRTSYDLVRDALPEGASLRDLGEQRLRDLTRPEHVFQLLHPALSADFPALQTLEARPNNLPVQPTPLIGREREIEAVWALLQRDAVRLVTLTGPGGIGKTRLALQIAADRIDEFPNGAFLVALAPISDPGLVPSAIAQALGIGAAGGAMLLQSVKEYLRQKQLLLVLDNFEQLLPAAPVVAELLAAARGLKVLVTSRAALRLQGEQEFPVPPLPVPDPKHLPPIASLSQYGAVELFIQRALAVKPDFVVTNENAPAVAQICHRLDGLPLAIVLAAARVKLFPPRALLARLQDRLALLTGGARDLPERHQTLRGAIAWSYDLLGEAEQSLFRRLSVFVGGCTFEAAEAVCNGEGDPEIDVLEGIATLVDHSLLLQEEAPDTNHTGDSEPRITMLETIREFARERLLASGEAAAVRGWHLGWVVGLAERAGPELFGREQAAWLDRLQAEHNNLRAAMDWSLEGGDLQAGLRIGGSVWRFCHQRGFRKEGYERLVAVLLRPEASARTRVRAKALDGAGVLAITLDNAAARSHYEEMLAIGRELGDKQIMAVALNGMGHVAQQEDNREQARPFFEQGLEMAREAGDWWEAAFSLHCLGLVTADERAAHSFLEEALAIRRELGDKGSLVPTLLEMAGRAHRRGSYRPAQALYLETLEIARGLDNKRYMGIVLWCLGALAREQGDYATARAYLEEAVAIAREPGSCGLGGALFGLGRVAQMQGDYAAARSCLEERVALEREGSPSWLLADALGDLGHVVLKQGDLAVARSLLAESVAILRGLDLPLVRYFIRCLADLERYQGDHATARSHYEEALALWQREEENLHKKQRTAEILARLALIAHEQGDLDRAAALGRESMALYREVGAKGEKLETVEFLEAYGSLVAALGQPARAARLLGAASAFREVAGAPLPPADCPEHERSLATARAALGEEAFAAAWAEGRAMTPGEAIAAVLQEDGRG